MKPIPDNAATSPEHQRLAELEEEVRRLQRTNRVLMDRVEQRINDEGGAFAAFQAASRLEKTIAERTAELRVLNERLEHELDLRRNFEGALLRAKQEAEDAMASRTRFLAAASHDLRQPLNAAVLYLEAMDRKQLSTANEDSFRGIGLALDTLDSLLSVLLDISRLDSGGLHPERCHFALQALFSRLAQEYGSLAEAKQLRLEVEDTDAVVHTDMMLLETVLRNLLSNAIKYTDRGKISIDDTGIGIPAEHLDRIFDEFWRAPGSSVSEKNSMGLGLSIVQRISRLLDSNIAVNSTPGSGSRFSLQVPCGDSRLLADVDSPARAFTGAS